MTTMTPSISSAGPRSGVGPTNPVTMPEAVSLDFTRGTHLACLEVEYDPATGAGEVIATMPVPQLLELVLDPKASEDPKRVAEDPRLARTSELRKEVQRAVEGAKAKNAVSFGHYLVEGATGVRPAMVPAITLFHPEPLDVVDLGGGLKALVIPFGDFFVALDGETQRIAWQLGVNEHPALMAKRVKVTIHFGKPISHARQGFYDLNTREVKPNAAVSISMDTIDPATRITRDLMEASDLLKTRGVNLTRRQLRATDTEVVTISALRTGITTTMFGSGGLAIGNRSTGDRLADLSKQQLDELGQAVIDVWVAILDSESIEKAFVHRKETVISAPSILAGIGIVAHHAMPDFIRSKTVAQWSVEDVVDALEGVNWQRATYKVNEQGEKVGQSVWTGIAGKFTPSGTFSIGGPKEVGHAVADALENPTSPTGRRIRA